MVDRITQSLPSFRRVFEESILWQLQRASLQEAVKLEGTEMHLLETNAWRADGIPPIRITYRMLDGDIEIVRVAVDMPSPPPKK
jgi:hypothetical protein